MSRSVILGIAALVLIADKTAGQDPCEPGAYRQLNEAWRNINCQADDDSTHCDSNINGEWYRFTGPAGDQILTQNPGRFGVCGTLAPVWMDGPNPTVADGVVRRQACVWDADGPCGVPLTIRVKACSAGYYVYQLPILPGCSAAYCGYTDTKWVQVFATVRGTGQKVIDAWNALPGENVLHDKCELMEQWESLGIKRVKLTLESPSGDAVLIFDGQNTDKFSWFNKSRLILSPWNDIGSQPQNFFSFIGDTTWKRRFYINRSYDTCPNDSGWLFLSDIGPVGYTASCPYELAPTDKLPLIRFSGLLTYTNWNNLNSVETADRMVVYIDADNLPPNPCSTRIANNTLNETGICYDPCEPGQYRVLNEAWRSAGNGVESPPRCDNNLNREWYRFMPPAGNVLVTVNLRGLSNICGTNSPMWMDGALPGVGDGVVSRQVCASWNGDPCRWQTYIQVKACIAGYHVYKLPNVPGCYLAYCGYTEVNECLEDNGGCEQNCTNTAGGFQCSCDAAFTLADDGLTCQNSTTTTEVTCGATATEASFYAISVFWVMAILANFLLEP